MKIQIHTQTHIQTQTSTGELHVVLRHLTLFPKNLEVLLMCIIYAYVLNQVQIYSNCNFVLSFVSTYQAEVDDVVYLLQTLVKLLEAYLCVVELFITIIICMCVCVFYRTNEINK